MSHANSADTSLENLALQARPWLVKLVDDYKRGVDEARQVAVLPETALEIGIDREERAAKSALGRVFGGERQVEGIHGLLNDEPGVRAKKERLAKERLAYLEQVPQFHAMLLCIRQSALVRAWATLEAFMEDVWTETLDCAGKKTRQGAFSSIVSGKDMRTDSKPGDVQVSMEFLVKHDFNLQNKLGTVLADRCTFKTVGGITRAYQAAFGWMTNRAAPAFPDPNALRAVEWKRHAIVHRGGIIDAEYAKKARLATSLIGGPLELSTEVVVDDINVITIQGAKLLGQLLLWLEAVEPQVGSATSKSDESIDTV
jgi:hypothetical protein